MPDLTYPIQSVKIGGRVFDSNYFYPSHVQIWHQFYLVLKGRVRIQVWDQSILLKPGEALWMAPELRREPRAASAGGQYLIVSFRSPWPELGGVGGRKFKVQGAAMSAARHCVAQQESNLHAQSIAFHDLCLRLLGARAFDSLLGIPQEGDTESGLWMVTQLERIMEANVSTPLGIEDMASLVHASRATLGRLFRRHRGTSPAARFRQIRLNRAVYLLRSGKQTITEIAHETGFSSSQHFATAFRQCFGKSPSATPRESILYTKRTRIERSK